LSPPRPDNRYEHDAPGDLLHLDIKKLGRFARPGHRVTGDRQQNTRGAGWAYVHIAIDDHSRVAFSSLHPDETGWNACLALLRAVRYYASLGVRFYPGAHRQRCMLPLPALTAPVPAATAEAEAKTPSDSTRTNGKAERFIQKALREWAYTRSYGSLEECGLNLPAWLHQYNWHRPHASQDFHLRVSLLRLSVKNLVGLHS